MTNKRVENQKNTNNTGELKKKNEKWKPNN